jgi:hypothetical protein
MRLFASTLALASFAAAGAAMASFSQPVVVKLETPVERASNAVVAVGVAWSCAQDTCQGRLERRKPMARDCGEVARAVGKVASFKLGDKELTSEELAVCNRRAR